MALAIDASPIGTATNNSYVTLAEADTYFDSRLNVSVWTDATTDNKNRALVQATRRIDYEEYYGDREFPDVPQVLSFPRINLGTFDGIDLDSIIPLQVKEATYELAIYMLSVDMSQPSVDTSTKSEVKIGSLAVKYNIDKGDNTTQNFDTLPPNVVSLLEDLSPSINSGAFFTVSR